MVYVFTDGHMIFDKKYLTSQDDGKYLAVEQLPDIPKVEGKIGFINGFDVDTRKILFGYSDIQEEPPEPEPPTTQPEAIHEPTEAELIQAEILLAQQAIVAKQKEQDDVLALLLLNQQKG